MILSPAPPKGDIEFPDSDGKPLAESPIHIEALIALRFAFRTFFREREDVYVGANMFLYYNPDNSKQVVAPDVFVVLGVPNRVRRSYKVWEEEGAVPRVIFEISSESTRGEDLHSKRGLYEDLGVQEYFLFDPLGEYLKPRLKGFYLDEGFYTPLTGEVLKSAALGLEFRVEGAYVRVHDPARGIDFLHPDEAELAREVAEERALIESLRAEQEAARAEQEAARAEQEAARAEEEVAARLVAEERAQSEAAARQMAEERAQSETAARQVAEERAQYEAAARQVAEEHAEQEATARQIAEDEITRLRAELKKLRGDAS